MNNDQKKRPWFGPKRAGFGVRPQTWQGWLIVGLFVIGILVVTFIVR